MREKETCVGRKEREERVGERAWRWEEERE